MADNAFLGWLKGAMAERGLDRKGLAKAIGGKNLGKTYQQIDGWLRDGKMPMDKHWRERLADALSVPMDELVGAIDRELAARRAAMPPPPKPPPDPEAFITRDVAGWAEAYEISPAADASFDRWEPLLGRAIPRGMRIAMPGRLPEWDGMDGDTPFESLVTPGASATVLSGRAQECLDILFTGRVMLAADDRDGHTWWSVYLPPSGEQCPVWELSHGYAPQCMCEDAPEYAFELARAESPNDLRPWAPDAEEPPLWSAEPELLAALFRHAPSNPFAGDAAAIAHQLELVEGHPVLATHAPTALTVLWGTCFVGDEQQRARAVAAVDAATSPIVRDAARIVRELDGDRPGIGLIADVEALRASLRGA